MYQVHGTNFQVPGIRYFFPTQAAAKVFSTHAPRREFLLELPLKYVLRRLRYSISTAAAAIFWPILRVFST